MCERCGLYCKKPKRRNNEYEGIHIEFIPLGANMLQAYGAAPSTLDQCQPAHLILLILDFLSGSCPLGWVVFPF